MIPPASCIRLCNARSLAVSDSNSALTAPPRFGTNSTNPIIFFRAATPTKLIGLSSYPPRRRLRKYPSMIFEAVVVFVSDHVFENKIRNARTISDFQRWQIGRHGRDLQSLKILDVR